MRALLSRRAVLASALAALAAAGGGLGTAGGAAPRQVRAAALKFGSFGWLLATMAAEGLDRRAGIAVEVRDIATHQAGPVALLAGETDLIVSDWLWALRQRALGVPLRFAPYSSALGAVMVPRHSGIASLADLAGKRLGVAGSAIDKSWLLLRAYSRKVLGRDLAGAAIPVFGAAPLIAGELERGRLDAALSFWTYAARLPPALFRPLIGVDDVLKGLGVAPVPPFTGYIWKEAPGAGTPPAIEAFLAAAAQGNAVLAHSDAAWERLRPLVKAAGETEFSALKAGYRAGIPSFWTEAETRSAEKVLALLVETGGEDLAGRGTRFDAALFYTPPGP